MNLEITDEMRPWFEWITSEDYIYACGEPIVAAEAVRQAYLKTKRPEEIKHTDPEYINGDVPVIINQLVDAVNELRRAK